MDLLYSKGGLIQKTQMNYMSRCFSLPWCLCLMLHLLSLCLHSKASRGGGKRTGLVYGRLCTVSQRQPEVDSCCTTAPFRVRPERRWWRKILPVGRTLGNTYSIHFVWKERGAKVEIHVDSWAISDGLVIYRDLERTQRGTWWHDGLGKRSVDGFLKCSQNGKLLMSHVNAM